MSLPNRGAPRTWAPVRVQQSEGPPLANGGPSAIDPSAFGRTATAVQTLQAEDQDEGQGEGRRPPLGTYGDRYTPPHAEKRLDQPKRRQEARSSRAQLKALQRTLTDSVSSRLCWYTVLSEATLDVGRELITHVSGIGRCGSPWSCPTCAPVIRERRAQEIDQALSRHLATGGGIEFVSLTVRHDRWDTFVSGLDVVSRALRLCLHGRPWDKRAAALGYWGAIRAVDVTWGATNGWHPHLHAVLIFERPLTDLERADLRRWLHGRWSGVCEARGLGTVSWRHGVDVQAVRTAGALSEYLTKVDGGWSAGLELSRSDLKKSPGRFTPMQLLGEFATTGETRMRALWLEYERATRGKRAIVWSPGLRKRLLGIEVEASDEELAASEGLGVALLRYAVPAPEWGQLVRAGNHVLVLDEFERFAGVLLVTAEVLGHEVEPVGPTIETRMNQRKKGCGVRVLRRGGKGGLPLDRGRASDDDRHRAGVIHRT